MSHYGLIAAAGPDTETFLQGQFTCDLRQVTPRHSRLGAWCSPKGRMLVIFRLFRRDDGYYLRLPRAQTGAILKRLQLYVLRAKTTLKHDDALAGLGVAGDRAAARLQETIGTLPAQTDETVTVQNLTVIRVPGHRFEVYGPAGAMTPLRTALEAQVPAADADAWRLAEILAGIPTVYPETADAFLPQMTHLQHLNGVSFRKGCYTGQEVVARTQYLGRLKRRMVLAGIAVDSPPAPGQELFSETGQSVGRIVDAARHPDGGCRVLAVVQT
ncbi:MAG: folate-binding protein, partial [Pseudomonadota bacterium]|nr:folate-binding protein [Pseudomonadota bacterium]